MSDTRATGVGSGSIQRRPWLARTLIGAAAAAPLLAGCTSSPDGEEAPTASEGSPSASSEEAPEETATDGEEATTEAAEQIEQHVEFTIHPGSATDGFVGALADATVSTCEAGEGVWNFAGTVVNPTEDTQSYRLYATLNTADNVTAALVQIDVNEVAAVATADWSGTAPVEGELTCSLRVERFTP